VLGGSFDVVTVLRTRLLLTCIATVAAIALGAAVAPALTVRATPKRITPSGVGAVKLGRTYRALRAAHLIGGLRPGCELEGATARSAVLRAPLKGFVDFTHATPPKVAAIAVRGGATARGIGIGASLARVRRAFPRATVDRSQESRLDVILVKVPKGGGGPLELALVSMTKTVTQIGIPRLKFCE
jgi:hypothetical protein